MHLYGGLLESRQSHLAPLESTFNAETTGSRLSYGEDPESLSHLALNPYWVVTDGQTDRPNRYS